MAIASSTWRRILRMRVVYFLILCVLVLIGSAVNYDVLSLDQHKPLMIDVSLVLNTIAAVLVVISMTFEIPKELREGVASTLLAKPLGRTQYIVGKMVGTIITAFVISGIIMLGFFFIFKLAFNEQIAIAMFQAHLMVIGSIIPMSGLAVLFSVMLPEMITPIATAIAIWFAYSTYKLHGLVGLYGGILPDLNLFNFKSYAVYAGSLNIDWQYIALASGWGVIFCIFSTSLASLIFSYKDIK